MPMVILSAIIHFSTASRFCESGLSLMKMHVSVTCSEYSTPSATFSTRTRVPPAPLSSRDFMDCGPDEGLFLSLIKRTGTASSNRKAFHALSFSARVGAHSHSCSRATLAELAARSDLYSCTS
ncbi:hypothetical protein F5Y09DRAFT_301068 [Xylaria sp. FL1042]|nr:hypothetical protein F5Y09DRAFT_301068 [Xylaria sp. FL1042]